jgi:hypothetical protein
MILDDENRYRWRTIALCLLVLALMLAAWRDIATSHASPAQPASSVSN